MRYAIAILTLAGAALAGPKEECLDAHGKGQDLRERGQLRAAKKAFFACAQSACPSLVQADCARFGEEIERTVPTVTFGARDARGLDLPETAVWEGATLLAPRLDGRALELDPGAHALRFVHEGREATLDLVLAQGEKGRFVAAVFKDDPARLLRAPAPAREEGGRSAAPLVFAGLGLAAAIGGGILLGAGLSSVPSSCSLSTRQCAAPAGDPIFARAESSVNLANGGALLLLGGSVTLLASVIGYLLQPTARHPDLAHTFSAAF